MLTAVGHYSDDLVGFPGILISAPFRGIGWVIALIAQAANPTQKLHSPQLRPTALVLSPGW